MELLTQDSGNWNRLYERYYGVILQDYFLVLSTGKDAHEIPSYNRRINGYCFKKKKWFKVRLPQALPIQTGARICTDGNLKIVIYGGDKSFDSNIGTHMFILSFKKQKNSECFLMLSIY